MAKKILQNGAGRDMYRVYIFTKDGCLKAGIAGTLCEIKGG
jgi:hypothetical protein